MTKKVYKVQIEQKQIETATVYIVAESEEEARTEADEMELDDGMFGVSGD